MADFFADITTPIPYLGPDTDETLVFGGMNVSVVGYGMMAEHLRFAVAYWHVFAGTATTSSVPAPSTDRGTRPSPPASTRWPRRR